jgi:hypothetical protein
MSDNESDDEYEYEYSDDEQNIEGGEGSSKVSKNGYASDVKGVTRTSKYLEVDQTRLSTWAGQCPIRLSIVSAIRQIVDHPSERYIFVLVMGVVIFFFVLCFALFDIMATY